MLEEEDDFETPQYRIQTLEQPKRNVQLRPHTPTFGRAPSIESFYSLNISVSFSEIDPETKNLKTLKRFQSMSLETINDQAPLTSHQSKEVIDPTKVKEQLKKLYSNPTPFIEEIVDKSANNQNQVIIDILDSTLFLPLSSIMRTYKDKKALIIVPSLKFSQWIRGFLTESTALCPEGRLQQQKVLNQMSTGRTQVLLCVSNRLESLSLSMFDIIFVVKSELFWDTLTPIYDFNGLLIIHQTPGYIINDSFLKKFAISRNPDVKPQCYPVCVFEDDYLDSLHESIHNRDETTIVIVPFKTTIDKIFKKIQGKSIKYENYTGKENKAVVATTAFLYNIFNFEHYIFVDFPSSLSIFLMSLFVAKKVTVFVNTPTAIKLQSLSHNCGVDLPILQQIVQDIFWSGSSYRKVNEFCAISTEKVDVTGMAFTLLIKELSKRHFLRQIPFEHQYINIKIISAIHQKSNILDAISFYKSNVHGYYNIPIISLCNKLSMPPTQIQDELESMALDKVVQFKFIDKAHYFEILKEFKDDDEFMNLIKELNSMFNQIEEEKDHEFDLLFTILKKESLSDGDDHSVLENILNGTEPPELIPIPHNPVDLVGLKKFLSGSKRGEWTPRAVARILHGISSPIFTAVEFARSTYWGKQPDTSFKEIMKICQSVVCNPDKINIEEEKPE